MYSFVWDRPEEVGRWVMDRVERGAILKDYTAAGVERDGRLIFGIVYHQYFPDVGDIQLVIASENPSWARPGVIGALLAFPFCKLGCQRVTCLIARKNKKSRRLAEGLGFVLEGKQRRGFRTDDLMIYGMLKEEASKWLERVDGQEKRAFAA